MRFAIFGYLSRNIVVISTISGAGTSTGIGTSGARGMDSVSVLHTLTFRNIYQNILRCRSQGGIGLSSNKYLFGSVEVFGGNPQEIQNTLKK